MTRWVGVEAFLSEKQSRGRHEPRVRGSEMRHHQQEDGDILTLLSLMQTHRSIRKVACVPAFWLCLYNSGSRLVVRHSTQPSCLHHALQIQGGVVITGIRSTPKLWLPENFGRILYECKRQGKRYAVCNCGLYDMLSGEGHANSLVFDLHERLIERFEPAGRHSIYEDVLDIVIEGQFRAHLRQWKYIGTRAAAPFQGVQEKADGLDGLCVTYTLLYILLRILNPSRSSREIQHYMIRGTADEVRCRAKRLNRYMLDRLRSHKRGTLTSPRKGA